MDQTLHYPNMFNRNSLSTTYIEPAISAPGEFHPYILSNEMQETSNPGGDLFHGGFQIEPSASSETFSGSLHMNNGFESYACKV
ncbi:hypothetical protein GcC1_206050 [Golovinomyces cichoracearum]|uniref:Uncharacterized protein n=1 Tax=Golovinomyces cichoracearum TaxID=62708 RepID=A0A420HCD3_9PEZI|nr:hypothetical protein GcC1_206050 [Golovinomyces cichoracearum]